MLVTKALRKARRLAGRVKRTVVPAVNNVRAAKSKQLVALRAHDFAAHHVQLFPEPVAFAADVTSPQVSVVVTAFNQPGLLAQTLSSMQRQSMHDWEAIVVNDASTDLTLDVAMAFARADSRFRVVNCARNGGLGATRNVGISLARSEFIAFLDGDDILFPDALKNRVAALAQHRDDPRYAGSFCDWVSFWGLDAPANPTSKPVRHGNKSALTNPYETPFIVSAPLFKKAVIESVGGFDEANVGAEDADFWHRVLRAGWWFNYAPYVGVGYRQQRGSLLQSNLVHNATVHRTLAAAADAPLADAHIMRGPMPFTEPMSVYLRDYASVRRNLRFAAMSLAQDDREAAKALVTQIDATVLTSAADNETINGSVVSALRRLGMSAEEISQTRDGVCDGLTALVHQASRTPQVVTTERVASTAHPSDGRGFTEVSARVTLKPATQVPAGAVVLVPEAKYHVDEFGPLAQELQSRGIPAVFMARHAVSERDKTLRDDVLRALGVYADSAFDWDPELPLHTNIRAVVTMNDWGPAKDLIVNTQSRSVATFAKVEGVQDFDDVDTGRERRPYRTADIILGQGPNDVAALAGKRVEIVGSTRLERIWLHGRQSKRADVAAVNLNFTYNVLTEHAQTWLAGAIDGSAGAGFKAEISVHPAQRLDIVDAGLLNRRISHDPLRHMLTYAGALITRFSTVAYEAAARGVPVIYLNAHDEKVWRALESTDAVFVARSAKDVTDLLERARTEVTDYKSLASDFFAAQVDIQSEPSEVRAANVIEANSHASGH
jgi:glycosyltransferase involved in cell wall biosynthesis